MQEKKFKQVCACKNCGNETEMVVTCSLEDCEAAAADPVVVDKKEGKIKGHAICTNCGGAVDIWLDI